MGSRSDLQLCISVGIRVDMVGPVRVRGGRIGRGEDGAELVGVVGGDMAAVASASGLHESLRRQASLQ